MPKRTRNYRESLLEALQDPAEAAEYLNAALDDSDEMALIALRDVAEARQMARVAGEAGVTREALYRMLRKGGNPTYRSLVGILHAVGLRITVVPTVAIDHRNKQPIFQATGVGAGLCGQINSTLKQGSPAQQTRSVSITGSLGPVLRKPPTIAQEIFSSVYMWAEVGSPGGAAQSLR